MSKTNLLMLDATNSPIPPILDPLQPPVPPIDVPREPDIMPEIDPPPTIPPAHLPPDVRARAL